MTPMDDSPSKPRQRQRRGTARTTMQEVAELAKVSPSTVSLYLRKPDAVSEKLGNKVQQAIDALHYVPNRIAGSLAAARSRTIAVIIPSISNSFFARTVRAMEEVAEAAGYNLLLGNSDFDPEREETLVRTFLEWSPAGVVLTGRTHTDATIGMLKNAGIPVGQMWDLGAPSFGLQVGFDNQKSGYAAAQHLYQGGCKNLVFLGVRMETDKRAKVRAEGYSQAVAEAGLHQPLIIDLPVKEAHVVKEAGGTIAAVLANDPSIDGVVCSNDWLALGVLFEAQRRGISVPDRLAMIGYGDIDFAESTVPPLSTIRPHRKHIGQELIKELITRCESDSEQEWDDFTLDVGFDLIPRGTSKLF